MTDTFDLPPDLPIDDKAMLNEHDVTQLREMEEDGRYRPTAEERLSAQNAHREALRKKWVEGLREQATKELNMEFLASIAFNDVDSARAILEKKHDLYGENRQVQIDIKEGHAFSVSAKSGNLEMLQMFADLQVDNEKWPTWVANLPNLAYVGGRRDVALSLMKDDRFGEYADIFSSPQMLLREAIFSQDKELITAIFARIPNRHLSSYYDFITPEDEKRLGDKRDSTVEIYYEALADRKKAPASNGASLTI